jgi:DNA-binding PadR family transcriptional regulator
MTRGDHLAEFELFVMLALARLGDEAYGVSIRREIEERTARPVSIGAVYATLGRLERKDLVVHEVSDPLPVQGGRSRKYYRLTRGGRAALRTSARMLGRMVQGLGLGLEPG